MKKCLAISGGLLLAVANLQAQVLLSGGLTYSQNFDSLASVATTTVSWTDNSTLPGWYAARAYTGGTSGPLGSYPYNSYRVSGGEINNGWIYSFGTNGTGPITDRAFGSISSGTPKTNAFGVRFQNDTTSVLGNVIVSYTGEQWRLGQGNVNFPNTLWFAYRIGTSLTDPGPNNMTDWTAVAALDFTSPIMASATTDPAMPLDGNAAANRIGFSNILIPGITLNPGEELFLRWIDPDETGNDMGLAVDDLSVNFSIVPEPSALVLVGLGVLALALRRRI